MYPGRELLPSWFDQLKDYWSGPEEWASQSNVERGNPCTDR